MHRIDDSRFLLYIEPKKEEKLIVPIYDELPDLLASALSHAKSGIANYSDVGETETFEEGDTWRGIHGTDCGERSNNKDYLLENGMITNSLAPFYLTWYRDSIPESEMNKVKELHNFYKSTL